jgi:hypothetical protein
MKALRSRIFAAILCALLACTFTATSAFSATPSLKHQTNVQSRPAKYGRAPLCQIAGDVNHVTVKRSRPLNRERFSFPATATGADASTVRSLAGALCAVPVEPNGRFGCPLDLGVRYTLSFVVAGGLGGSIADPVVVDPDGCQTVSGLGRTRSMSGHSKIWSVLGVAIGMRHATGETFLGKLPPQSTSRSKGSTSTSSTSATNNAFTTKLIVSRTTVSAGAKIPARLVITNRTGRDFTIYSCLGDATFEIGIGNSAVPFDPISGAIGCGTVIKTGVNVFPEKIWTSYQGCGGPPYPKCGKPPRITSLPAGHYRTDVIWVGVPSQIPHPDSIVITLH